jgi:hypothetical protein
MKVQERKFKIKGNIKKKIAKTEISPEVKDMFNKIKKSRARKVNKIKRELLR